jgi:D-beta-D-heptose 7-phosphate kinase/D-beta-D-heptose 1-phosphate adenosyltransferase
MTELLTLKRKLDFTKARVLCLGDVMLDKFVYGEAARLSPEAPIPVNRIRREEMMPGGAGNVARNVATLGATAVLISVVGEDDAATQLGTEIAQHDRILAHLVKCPDRLTTVKTRFVVSGQQLLRADSETVLAVEGKTAERVLAKYEAELEHADVVVLSDYGKGLLFDAVLRPVIDLAQSRGKPVIVDPKSKDFSRYRGTSLLVPNAAELTAATGMPCSSDDEAAAAAAVAGRANNGSVLVTRSKHGMTLSTLDDKVVQLPAQAQEVYDVSGAGDTVAATVAVGLAAGFDLEDAACLANIAAGIVVGKVGTAAVYLQDLVAGIQSAQVSTLSAEIVPLEQAQERTNKWRARGLRVGFTNGCFDLIHPGHVSLLRQARAACDRLIVGLNNDASTKRLKGEGRPIQSETARSIVLASLNAVDLVVLFDEDTPIELIEALRPEVLVKGADYTKEQVVGANLVSSYGGEVVLAELEQGFSTTRMIAEVDQNRKRSQRAEGQRRRDQGARTTT